jgi:anti-sigma factor RsiW
MAESYLSGELLGETNHEVLQHLRTCPECRADLDARRAVRESMRRAFRNAAELEPRPEFVADLRDRLRQAALAAPPRRFGLGRGWWLLAASLVLGVALAGIFVRYGSVTPSLVLAQLAAGDHQNCALRFRLTEKPISLEEAAQQYGAVYQVLQQLPPNDLMTAGGLAHVVERHSCVYGGRRFAHVVIKYRGALVSLLVTRDDGRATAAIPDDALTQVRAEGRIEGMSVVSFRAARHMVFLVGDLAQGDLLRLATVAAGSLRQQLSGI